MGQSKTAAYPEAFQEYSMSAVSLDTTVGQSQVVIIRERFQEQRQSMSAVSLDSVM